MKRLCIATSILFFANFAVYGIRWILASGIPLADIWVYLVIALAMVALTYFATLEASPFYYLYQREGTLYAAAALIGAVLGVF